MMLSLSLMAPYGCCPSGLVLYQDQPLPKCIQDLRPLLSATSSRPEMLRSTILTVTPYMHDDLLKLRTEFYEYSQFVKSASIKRMPMFFNVQELSSLSILFGLSIDEQLRYQQILQVVLSGSSELKEDFLDRHLLPYLASLQEVPADLHQQLIATTDLEFDRLYLEKSSHLQEADCHVLQDLPSTISVHPDEQFSFVGNMADMTDQVSVFAKFALTNDMNPWRKQKVLVPHFRWNDTIELHDHIDPSTLKLETVTAAPLKSPEKVKQKTAPKRKNKKGARERDLYKNNSLHACEIFLSLLMDKKRNGKSVLNALKKLGPELPQLLTQFSASVAGTGLAVVFSVIYKLASGSIHFCTSNVLALGFGVGVIWLSWGVNRLRSTIVYISKNSSKLEFQEEEMMKRVDNSVKDIVFRAAASMAVLMLRFA